MGNLPNVPTPQESTHHALHEEPTERDAEAAELRAENERLREKIKAYQLDYELINLHSVSIPDLAERTDSADPEREP